MLQRKYDDVVKVQQLSEGLCDDDSAGAAAGHTLAAVSLLLNNVAAALHAYQEGFTTCMHCHALLSHCIA